MIDFIHIVNLIDNKTILRALVVSDAEHLSGSTTGRLENFFYTWENFKNHPLFGIGLSSYPVLNNFLQPHPHNIFLELINYGLIYALSFIFIISYMFYKSNIFIKRQNKYEEVLRQTAIYSIVFVMFSGDLFYSKDFYISLFLFYILNEKEKIQCLIR
jgi:O-antigen ligase